MAGHSQERISISQYYKLHTHIHTHPSLLAIGNESDEACLLYTIFPFCDHFSFQEASFNN